MSQIFPMSSAAYCAALASAPTSDPGVAGAYWNNARILTVSTAGLGVWPEQDLAIDLTDINVWFASLPITDPNIPGAVWDNAGVPTASIAGLGDTAAYTGPALTPAIWCSWLTTLPFGVPVIGLKTSPFGVWANDSFVAAQFSSPDSTAMSFFRRVRSLLPQTWFPGSIVAADAEIYPAISGLISGFASMFANVWNLFNFANDATRLATASGELLDMASVEFFGEGVLPRQEGESDTSYLARIQQELVATRNTREAVQAAINASGVTGSAIIESYNAADCGSWSAQGVSAARGGYGVGTLRYSGQPGQFFTEFTGDSGTIDTARRNITRVKASGVRAWYRVKP